MSRARTATREDRRRAELEERRARRRATRRPEQRRSLLLPLSVGAVVIGIVAVAAFAIATAPPPAVDLRAPVAPTEYGLADGQALGRTDAPVTIEIYSDYQCPACGVLATTVKPMMVQDYVETGQVRVLYRDFAFLGDESINAAVAARCAAAENRFWQFHDYLFANQQGENRGAFSSARLAAIASAVELDADAYQSCISDPSQRQAVLDARTAASAIPITSTPTLVLNGERIITGVPSYADLEEAIEAELGTAVEVDRISARAEPSRAATP